MSKRKKLGLILTAIVLVSGILVFHTLSEKFGPVGVAQEYMEAIKRKDAERMYSYLELEGDTTFASKELFRKWYEKEGEEISKIANYKFLKTTYGDENLSATVSYKVTNKGSSGEYDAEVRLIKNSEKKWLIFDSWSIAFDGSQYVTKNYRISVPSGASVTVGEIALTEKYKDSKDSTTSLDVYILPQILRAEVEIKTVLANGITINDTVSPSSYQNNYTASLTLKGLDEKTQATLREKIKKDVTSIYTNIIAKKSWNDVKNSYNYEGAELSNFQKFYTNLASNIKDDSYRTLKKFSVTNVSLNSATIDKDGRLHLSVRISYDYTIDYRYYSSAKPETRSSSSSFTTDVYYDYVKGDYKLNRMGYGVSYFSGY